MDRSGKISFSAIFNIANLFDFNTWLDDNINIIDIFVTIDVFNTFVNDNRDYLYEITDTMVEMVKKYIDTIMVDFLFFRVIKYIDCNKKDICNFKTSPETNLLVELTNYEKKKAFFANSFTKLNIQFNYRDTLNKFFEEVRTRREYINIQDIITHKFYNLLKLRDLINISKE